MKKSQQTSKFVLSRIMTGPTTVYYMRGQGNEAIYTTVPAQAQAFSSFQAANDYKAANWLSLYNPSPLPRG